MRPERFAAEVWAGAVSITSAIKAVDPAIRLDALAIACDAYIKTNGQLTEEAVNARQ